MSKPCTYPAKCRRLVKHFLMLPRSNRQQRMRAFERRPRTFKEKLGPTFESFCLDNPALPYIEFTDFCKKRIQALGAIFIVRNSLVDQIHRSIKSHRAEFFSAYSARRVLLNGRLFNESPLLSSKTLFRRFNHF